MKDALIIGGIALAVFALAFVIWLVRLLMNGRKQRRKMHERRVEDAEREEMFSPERTVRLADEYREMEKLRKEVGAPILDLPKDDDDTTKTWPPEKRA